MSFGRTWKKVSTTHSFKIAGAFCLPHQWLLLLKGCQIRVMPWPDYELTQQPEPEPSVADEKHWNWSAIRQLICLCISNGSCNSDVFSLYIDHIDQGCSNLHGYTNQESCYVKICANVRLPQNSLHNRSLQILN